MSEDGAIQIQPIPAPDFTALPEITTEEALEWAARYGRCTLVTRPDGTQARVPEPWER